MNTECFYFQQYIYKNRVSFKNTEICKYCSFSRKHVPCFARKCVAYSSDKVATICHIGDHICSSRDFHKRKPDVVKSALSVSSRSREAKYNQCLRRLPKRSRVSKEYQMKRHSSQVKSSQVNFISEIRIYIHKKIQFSTTEINIEIKATATTVIKNRPKYFLMSEGNTCTAEPNLEVLTLI